VYPVTIDPAASWSTFAWTMTNAAAPTTSYWNSASTPRVGTYASTGPWRLYVNFLTSTLRAKHILSASIAIPEVFAASCTAQPFNLQPSAGITPSTTWNNQPTRGATFATITSNVGGGTSCPSANVNANVTSWAVAAVANTASNQTTMAFTTNEADTSYYKRFGSNMSITVNYNSYPSSVSQLSVGPCASGCPATGTKSVNSARPTFTSDATDADGGNIDHYFYVYSTANSSTPLVSGHSTISGNGTASWQVPAANALPDGTYTYTAQASDGTDTGAMSAAVPFTVDATAPSAPSVSSSTQPAGALTISTDFTFTAAPTASDNAAFAYRLDGANYSAWIPATATMTRAIHNVNKDALHTLAVIAQDPAGNVSTPATYSFGGGLTSPADQGRTQRYLTLTAEAPPTYPYVAYQWRQGTTAAWADVRSSDVSVTGGGAPSSWPVSSIGTSYGWNLASSMSGTDGLAEVRACLYTSRIDPSPVCLDPNDVTLAATSFGDSQATSQVGPGSVSLLTGDFQVSAGDVSAPTFNGTLSIGRSLTTLATPAETAGPTGVFGPGWSASLPGTDAGAGDASVDDQTSNGYIDIRDSDGSSSTYEATSSVSTYPISFTGVGDAAAHGSMLQKTNASTVVLTDTDGTKTTWTSTSSGWLATGVQEPGSQTATSYTRDSTGRITRILGPLPTGISCTAAPDTTIGCRSLKLTYTTMTVGGVTLTRLQAATFVAYNPQTSAMVSVEVASYDYDTNGRLAYAWDPRISLNLRTAYTYDSTGRLSTIAAPGLAAWTLNYDSNHRLTSVSQPDGSTMATTTVAYGVAVSDISGPVDFSAAAAATWGQTADLPVTGTAVFGADHVPSGIPTSTDWPYASISYLDVDGRTVNTAAYGADQWLIDTTRFDSFGNPVWALSAGNRSQALSPTADTDLTAAAVGTSAQAANLLASTSAYDADGSELIDSYGPIHPVQLDNGTLIDARSHSHSHSEYDQGAPGAGIPYLLPTTITNTVWGVSRILDRASVVSHAAVAAVR